MLTYKTRARTKLAWEDDEYYSNSKHHKMHAVRVIAVLVVVRSDCQWGLDSVRIPLSKRHPTSASNASTSVRLEHLPIPLFRVVVIPTIFKAAVVRSESSFDERT